MGNLSAGIARKKSDGGHVFFDKPGSALGWGRATASLVDGWNMFPVYGIALVSSLCSDEWKISR